MNNAIGSCGPVIEAQGSACILPIKAFTVGEALTSGQWRCYNGGMYVVCKDFDGKLNYPDSKYFKGPYGLEDVLNGAIQPCAGDMLCLCPPIWGACNTDGSVCVPAYGLRACAWDYDPVLKEYRFYTSLKADNHIKPYEGSIANPKTWDGGYDVCGYLNRPVAKDLEGNIYYPGNVNTIFCGVSCAEVNNPDFRFEGGKLRVNFPTVLDAKYMNGVMMELLNAISKSCQQPIPFDANNPDSYNQLWLAITRFGGSCGVNRWANGTTDQLVLGSDCEFYVANKNGSPATNDPVLDTAHTHWFGGFCSIGAALNKIMSSCCSSSGGTITPVECDDCDALYAYLNSLSGSGQLENSSGSINFN